MYLNIEKIMQFNNAKYNFQFHLASCIKPLNRIYLHCQSVKIVFDKHFTFKNIFGKYNTNKKINLLQLKLTEHTEMIKLTDFSQEQLSSFLLSYKETSLSLKIGINSNQDLPMLETIEKQLGKLIHLKELELIIPKNTILTVEGYTFLSNAIIKLEQLHKLSIKIESSCFLQDEGLAILQNTINTLAQLVYLKLQIKTNNFITSEATQQFLDSLAGNNKLTTLNIHMDDIQSSKTNVDNLHFWRGLSNLRSLEKLVLSFDDSNYSESDLDELYSHIINHEKLKHLSLILKNKDLRERLLWNLFPYIRKMVELRSLKINYINGSININNELGNLIIKNLNNLTLLEKLKLNQIEYQLIENNFDEYVNLIGNLKNLKEFSFQIQGKNGSRCAQQQLLGQSLLSVKNLTHLELVFSAEKRNLDNQFLKDLSESFSQMQDLLDVTLEFNIILHSKGFSIIGESFLHLLKIQRFKLKLQFEYSLKETGFFYNIRYFKKFKELDVEIKGQFLEDGILYESIAQLDQLEKLNLQRITFKIRQRGIVNLQELCNILLSLRKLKSLKFNVSAQSLEDQQELSMFENSFKQLKELQYLSINFNIRRMSEGLENHSFIRHLVNLKEIEINFMKIPLNIFGNSEISTTTSLSKLENCCLSFQDTLDPKQLNNILDSLSKQSNLLKLELKHEGLEDYVNCKEQFGIISSSFRRIEKLIINDNGSGNCSQSFYAEGIKQMKSLKTLKLIYGKIQFDDQDIKELDDALLQLSNLQKLIVFLHQTQTIAHIVERLQLSSLKSFWNLKKLILNTRIYVLDKNKEQSSIRKDFEFTKALKLDFSDEQESTNQKIALNNQIESSQQLLVANEIEKQQQDKNNRNKENPVTLNLYIYLQENNEQNFFCLNEFDFHNMKQLDTLTLTFNSYEDIPVTIPFNLPLIDLKNDHKLITLSLYLNSCVISQQLITYFSKNLQYLTHLQFFNFQTEQYQDYYYLLFDSLQYLISLKGLFIDTNITEDGAISIGNSLHAMKRLEDCDLNFNKGSTFGIKGIFSIVSGLKQARKLRKLTLNLSTSQIIDEDSQITIEQSVLSHLSMLEELNVQLKGTNTIRPLCRRQFMQSIGSLAYLSSLIIKTKKSNPFNQEMLDALIVSINSLQFLQSNFIMVYLSNQNETITMSREFAKLLNQQPKSELTIITQENKAQFFQDNVQIYLKSNSMDNLHIEFLDNLVESIKVKFKICESKIVKNIKLCTARKVDINVDNFQSEGEEIGTACELISRMQKTFKLKMVVNMTGQQNVDSSLIQLAQNLSKINFLQVLHLTIFQNGNSIQYVYLNQMLNVLKNLQQLRGLSLKTKESAINKKMIPLILKTIMRLVNFDYKKQFYPGRRQN